MKNVKNSDNSEEKPKRWGLVNFITPIGSIRRAVSSVAHTTSVIKDSVRVMGKRLPSQKRQEDYEVDDLRAIADSSERFEAMYAAGGWSEEELLKQIVACRRTKITAICMIIFSFVGIAILAISAPVWMAIFLIPASGSLLILGTAMTFKYALMQTQLLLRNLIAANEFVARDDFWKRLIG